MSVENIKNFLNIFSTSVQGGTFVKLTLGNYKGADKSLQRILVRLIHTKKGLRTSFLYRYNTRDTAKNYSFEKGNSILKDLLGTDFFAAHLFTTENDFQLDIGKKGRSRLNTGKPTFRTAPTFEHNRKRNHLIDQDKFYLKALGITTDEGRIKTTQQDKFKQINHFVETLKHLVEGSELSERKELRIVDMGSGKGYLTFAAYDYFSNVRNIDVKITGVDTKSELVALCNDIAKSSDFDGLHFVEGKIDTFEPENADILIALHACNTATDDAIFKAIKNNISLIVVAPCCHQEIRPQMQAPKLLSGILKHGSILEREAESITDGIRAMLLEEQGYKTQIFEFISTEHTPKNNMIVGKLTADSHPNIPNNKKVEEIMNFYGIKTHRLKKLLENSR
ncbi:MAG: class I SAM-dependent methyltransferase [Pyrinomonadaceae bacterium]